MITNLFASIQVSLKAYQSVKGEKKICLKDRESLQELMKLLY